MTFLAIYGGLHLLAGLITLLYMVFHEYTTARRTPENLAPFPQIIWNALVIVTCWPAIWMDR